MEENIDNFVSTEIEWLPLNNVELLEDQKNDTIKFLESLEDNDDVQNVYSNVSFKG